MSVLQLRQCGLRCATQHLGQLRLAAAFQVLEQDGRDTCRRLADFRHYLLAARLALLGYRWPRSGQFEFYPELGEWNISRDAYGRLPNHLRHVGGEYLFQREYPTLLHAQQLSAVQRRIPVLRSQEHLPRSRVLQLRLFGLEEFQSDGEVRLCDWGQHVQRVEPSELRKPGWRHYERSVRPNH